jgi:hypothetical protein
MDYAKRFSEAVKEMAGWIAEDKLKRRFTVVDGLDKAPEALSMLFSGGNTGKMCVSYLFFFSFSIFLYVNGLTISKGREGIIEHPEQTLTYLFKPYLSNACFLLS